MGIERLKYMGLRVMIEAFKFYNHWTLLFQALSQLNQPSSYMPKALLDPSFFFKFFDRPHYFHTIQCKTSFTT